MGAVYVAIHIEGGGRSKSADNIADFERMNEVLQTDPRVRRELPIYASGGINSIFAGLRSPEQAMTADFDPIYGPDVTSDERVAFENAFALVSMEMRNLGYRGFFLDVDVANRVKAVQGAAASVESHRNAMAWKRRKTQYHSKFVVYHTNWLHDLVMKMAQIAEHIEKCNTESKMPPEKRHIEDAVGLLQKAVAVNGNRRISFNQLEEVADVMDVDIWSIIVYALTEITDKWDGFSPDVKHKLQEAMAGTW